MKKVFLILVLLAAVFFGLSIYNNYTANKNSVGSITSPLPYLLSDFLVANGDNKYWRPTPQLLDKKIVKPEVTAKSALAYDLTTNQFLYEKDIKTRIPLASLTKIMTAVIALENIKLDKEFTVTKSAAEVGENTMGLTEGEKLTLEELLYGLVLHSGNDAAETIAQGSQFGRDNFVYLMNKKAENMGLSDTHFTNPSGLEGDGKQYSTTYDLLVMTRYALENPEFASVVATVEKELPYSEKHKYLYLFNETNLLTSYPGVKGVKTGYTGEAGLCLVTYLEYNGHKIIAILLNAQNRRQEMKDLLDYSLKTLGIKPPPHS